MREQDEYIRILAYQLWEAEGRPEGKADKHWQEANILVAGTNNKNEKNPVTQTVQTPRGPIEPAQPDQT